MECWVDPPCDFWQSDPVESDIQLAADSISTIYSAYVSSDKKGAEVPVKSYA